MILAAIAIVLIIIARELFAETFGGHHLLILAAELGGMVLVFRLLWLAIGNWMRLKGDRQNG